jgi:DNA-directed RNA polymerase sigma subunit (sigma70/sigma32)
MNRSKNIERLKAGIGGAMKTLTSRESYVLNGWASGRTLHEMAMFLGLSRERVRQIKDKASKKIRLLLPLTDNRLSDNLSAAKLKGEVR